ncbi:MinD-like ATPase involved in chromosome partitioning or flagellar assembly [Micromonospora matsumotoense]|uniref:MinD-like ATPase involved in chromosome partitioning or flagellar assembly n=1 Tax=Micromonospora matsumotoense TaxID=121616 RepID=A0A1C4U879_9ACTN|nr:AAA family ATPase [Micromonospora matsumotoense]SCE67817.1 MinD-like ATPase involved in chromosome partitioning or flagellar assembly [Micromonospora matsumotoense]
MDGSETGWGRSAEPAPRWRALFERARLGGRAAEQAEPERRGEDPARDPLPGRGPAGGWSGRGSAAVPPPADPGYGANPGYDPDPGYRAEASYRVDPAHRVAADYPAEPGGYRAEPGYPAEPGYRAAPGYPADPGYLPEPARPPEPPVVPSRYALLDNGYRSEPPPPESRYALLDNGYRAPGYAPPEPTYQPPQPAYPEPAYPEPGYPAAPTYQPEQPAYQPEQPAYPPAVTADRGYPARIEPARIEWRQQGPQDEQERAAGILRRDLGTPRVLAFANPKGGVHKTTATVLAAATVGSVRGRGVLAWDDNELRGTLGLRAGSARHARTIRHLISDLAHIEIRDGAELLESLDDYLRHASDGSYDVLAGEESPRFAQRLDQFTVKRVLELLRRTHDVVCVDTGNNVESPNWRTVMHAADQLVVTTVPREDAAFSADWMLDLLHEEGMGELADNAITLISCPTPGRSTLQDDLERHFATRTRAVAVVPYDPVLETGSSIEYHQLQAETRAAWLRAASVMLEPFAR